MAGGALREARALELVRLMHEQFGIGYAGPPRHLSEEEKTFRVAALREEVEEYAEADDLLTQYDALLDLAVFCLGTLYLHGFPFMLGHTAVMSANMRKEVGPNHKRGGFKADLRKPPGWEGPEMELAEILRRAESERKVAPEET